MLLIQNNLPVFSQSGGAISISMWIYEKMKKTVRILKPADLVLYVYTVFYNMSRMLNNLCTQGIY